MPHRYSTALSHLVLAGTSIYCLYQIKDSPFSFPHVSFGIITVNSVIGVWRWGNPDYGEKADKVYKFTTYLQFLFAMPCITTAIWLGNGYRDYLSWTWALLPTVHFVLYLLDAASDVRDDIMEVFIPCGLIAMGVVSFLAENYWGIATAAAYALNHYVMSQDNNFDIPKEDLNNYGLCFFTYFASRAVSQGP